MRHHGRILEGKRGTLPSPLFPDLRNNRTKENTALTLAKVLPAQGASQGGAVSAPASILTKKDICRDMRCNQAASAESHPRITDAYQGLVPSRTRVCRARVHLRNQTSGKQVVPEVGLEPTSLAAEDFESSASTIPPLGPLNDDLAKPRRNVNYRRFAENVSQSASSPDLTPMANQRDRCAEVPCVKVCGITSRPALRAKVSSPI